MKNNHENQVKLLIHEVSNPLMIATSLVEIMIANPELEKLEEVHDNLKRISLSLEEFKGKKNA